MPPVGSGDVNAEIMDQVSKNKVMIYSKTTCGFCTKIKALFKSLDQECGLVELDKIANGGDIQKALLQLTGQKTVPNVFVNGNHLGGCDDTLKAHKSGSLQKMLTEATSYDYDLIVIGGGSGGLAASKEAADLGKKVAVFDFVKPTPIGTTWGLGGTCVNVGCIPKKLMHQAAILGHGLKDAQHFGWQVPSEVEFNWDKMRNAIQDYISSLNWTYRVQLRDKKVDYQNAYAEFVDNHTVKAVNKKGKEIIKTSRDFIVAVGERPRYPDIPGAQEYGITSDDLFSLPYCPGKTLLIGASYVSLECGGFLQGMGLDVTIMVRSILLRGFDQQMADKIGNYMESNGVNFVRPCVPTKIEKLEDGQPGKYTVYGKYSDGTEYSDTFNTVIFAIGRDPVTSTIGLDKAGVSLAKNGKVIADEKEATNVPNIYAIGDILEGKLELTPVAIQAGKLLARRLYDNGTVLTDYINVPTTVFTPLEYGAIGYSEEAAIEKFGNDNIEVYHSIYWPLEWTVAQREENVCYCKIICHIPEKERVIGFHICGPNAGEITQGYALGMRLGATKKDLDDTIGIHPTCSEHFTTLNVTKRSGDELAQGGC